MTFRKFVPEGSGHRNNRHRMLVSVKKLSPQNGGFIRATLACLRTFCAKANGNF